MKARSAATFFIAFLFFTGYAAANPPPSAHAHTPPAGSAERTAILRATHEAFDT